MNCLPYLSRLREPTPEILANSSKVCGLFSAIARKLESGNTT